MTRIFAVDKNNDLYINEQGMLAINTGLQSVLQNCEHAAKAQLNEMVLNYDQGVPNFQTIWNGSPNIAQFRAGLRRAILAVEGVTNIDSLEITVSNNVLSYSAIIATIYGPGILNG